jgi:hypothetical protein
MGDPSRKEKYRRCRMKVGRKGVTEMKHVPEVIDGHNEHHYSTKQIDGGNAGFGGCGS